MLVVVFILGLWLIDKKIYLLNVIMKILVVLHITILYKPRESGTLNKELKKLQIINYKGVEFVFLTLMIQNKMILRI